MRGNVGCGWTQFTTCLISLFTSSNWFQFFAILQTAPVSFKHGHALPRLAVPSKEVAAVRAGQDEVLPPPGRLLRWQWEPSTKSLQPWSLSSRSGARLVFASGVEGWLFFFSSDLSTRSRSQSRCPQCRSLLGAGLHKLWTVLLSWADRGSCAPKCVS